MILPGPRKGIVHVDHIGIHVGADPRNVIGCVKGKIIGSRNKYDLNRNKRCKAENDERPRFYLKSRPLRSFYVVNHKRRCCPGKQEYHRYPDPGQHRQRPVKLHHRNTEKEKNGIVRKKAHHQP